MNGQAAVRPVVGTRNGCPEAFFEEVQDGEVIALQRDVPAHRGNAAVQPPVGSQKSLGVVLDVGHLADEGTQGLPIGWPAGPPGIAADLGFQGVAHDQAVRVKSRVRPEAENHTPESNPGHARGHEDAATGSGSRRYQAAALQQAQRFADSAERNSKPKPQLFFAAQAMTWLPVSFLDLLFDAPRDRLGPRFRVEVVGGRRQKS